MKYLAYSLTIIMLFPVILLSGEHRVSTKSLHYSMGRQDFELPKVQHIHSEKNMNVFYIHDELPQLTLVASIGYGSLYETSKNAGLASLLAKTIMLGGTKKYPGRKLSEKIERVGGNLNIAAGWEQITISIQVLQEHSSLAFNVMQSILTEPNFEDSYYKLALSLMLEKVKREKDDPFSYAYGHAREIIFQKKGYGARITSASLQSLALDDLRSTWSKIATTGNTVIGILSALPFQKVRQAIAKNFNSLPEGDSQEYTYTYDRKTFRKQAAKIYFIPKDIPQATIIMGVPAPSIASKKIYELKVMNNVLGGGNFTSRLMQEIRVKRGLAYSTGSVIRFRKDEGIFVLYAQCGTGKTVETVTLIQQVINDISSKPVQNTEREHALSSIANSYIFQFDTPQQVLSQYLSLWYNQLDDTFIRDYLAHIKSVTSAGITRSAASLFEDGLVTVVIGDPALKKELEKLTHVELIEEK